MVTTGWVQQEDLPTRWLTREVGGVRQFMGANNQIFASFSEAYDFLYSNKERFDVREMTTFYSAYSKYSFQSPAVKTSSTIGMVDWMLDITKTKLISFIFLLTEDFYICFLLFMLLIFY